MKLGPAIPAICGGECDTFSRRYRRMRVKFVKAGDYAYYKRKYRRRTRAAGKRELHAAAMENRLN